MVVEFFSKKMWQTSKLWSDDKEISVPRGTIL